MYEPTVLLQVALASQLSVFAVHSSMSVQVEPSPVKPVLHSQLNPPSVLVQAALAPGGGGEAGAVCESKFHLCGCHRMPFVFGIQMKEGGGHLWG